ncbi:type II secretion system F family protein [Candidatus Parcubacteria bacterium]|nr:MAG: type II secretion system F family protein [Candidatus Parcubacteria bacterium]
MKFRYQARTQEGEMQVGFVEAPDQGSATNILASHNLFILSIEAAARLQWYERLAGYFGRVRRRDMVIFTRQLATLLEARLPLSSALKTLHEQTTNASLREAVLQISEDIDSGLSFSQAMERQSNIFPEFYITMVQGAEVTGNLDAAVGFLADYTEREAILAGKAVSALTYPGMVIGLFVIVSFIMVAFVFPQVEPVFDQSGVSLPVFSRILLEFGSFLSQWWFMVILVFIILFVVALDYFRTPEGKAILDDAKIRLPIVKRIYLPLVITRFANAMALLLKGGVPVAQALEIVGHITENAVYQEVLRDVADGVRQGEPLSQAVGKYPEHFPLLIPQMLAVGETTGKLDQIFARIAGFYNREAEGTITNIVDLIQPLLLIGIGTLVGLLFASILVPIYQLTSTIGR